MAEVLNTGGEVNNAAPEGHDQAMMDAVDQKEAELANIGNDAPTGEGEKILGKFDSQEDLVKAYQELERKMSQQSQEPTEQKSNDKVDVSEISEDQANDLVEKAGLDMDTMADHYYENGSLSDEHYAALEEAGIPREYVDQYIAGVQAEAEQIRDQIFDEVGGEEQFAAMSEWAAANLSEQELNAYNEAVESGDMSVVRSAVMSLAFRYQRDAGRDPNLVGGNNGGLAGFESLAQLTAAMKDPRYTSDPAYRREVEQKLARSNIM
jgi:hypothetical protein